MRKQYKITRIAKYFIITSTLLILAACGGGDGDGGGDDNTINVPSTTNYEIKDSETKNLTFSLDKAGTITLYTKGNLDMEVAYLRDEGGTDVTSSYSYTDDVSGSDYNFWASASLSAGNYSVGIYEWDGRSGSFTLHVEFTPANI